MNWVDIVISILVLGAALLGHRIGLLRTTFLVGAFVLGIIISAPLSVIIASPLDRSIDNPNTRETIGFTVAFILIFGAVNAAGNVVCRIVNFTPLKWVDRWIGIALGFLAGIILVGLIIAYLTKSPTSGSDQWISGSAFAPIIRDIVGPIFREFMERKSLLTPVASGRMM